MRRVNLCISLLTAAGSVAFWGHDYWYFTRLGYKPPDIVSQPLPAVLAMAALVTWVLFCVGGMRAENSTCCRRCGYILRGLSEPRCPECGEHI